MPDSKPDSVDHAQAEDSLDVITEMERAALIRGMPPRWFGAGMAIIVACFFAITAWEEVSHYFFIPGAALVFFMIYAREYMGAYVREWPVTWLGRLAILGFAVLVMASYMGGKYVGAVYDVTWAPIATGAVIGVCVFILSESERRSYLARIEKQNDGASS